VSESFFSCFFLLLWKKNSPTASLVRHQNKSLADRQVLSMSLDDDGVSCLGNSSVALLLPLLLRFLLHALSACAGLQKLDLWSVRAGSAAALSGG
jgi:hypothetical protein